MIQVQNISKLYGPHKAVDSVSFSIGKGEVVGFLGPNGAGKSTTMNILTGYLSSTSGTVLIDGQNILEYPEAIKAKIGYLPESPPLYPDMTVIEYLRFVAELKRIDKARRMLEIEESLERVGVANVRKRLIRNLSKGYRQRVGFAQALLGNPEILVLDEPTAGLDPNQILDIRELIVKLGQSHTVILSSHIMQEISAVCGRVLIIHQGRIVADGNPATIASEIFTTGHVLLTVAGTAAAVEPVIKTLKGYLSVQVVASAEPNAVDVDIETPIAADLRREVFAALAQHNLPILQMRTHNMTLEELFHHLTTDRYVANEKEAV